MVPPTVGLSGKRHNIMLDATTAYTHFQSSIAAAEQLVAMYSEVRRYRGLGGRGRLDAANKDLLWLPRSAVVASLSALDVYVHTVLYERIPHALQDNPVPNGLCAAMADIIPIKNGAGFRDALPIFKSRDVVVELRERLKEKTLVFASYQTPGKIMAGYELIGYSNIFQEVANFWSGPCTTDDDIKRHLANYVKRRNQIAHEGDRDAHGNPRPMQPAYANNCREFTANLVAKLNRVVYGISAP